MSKKTQLSLFLVFGLVILIAFEFITYMLSINPESAAHKEKETI